jgi:RNA polymerase sigma-70 factor (ECF subfamily)
LHCYRLVGSLDDAEDMVQEALVRSWHHRDRLSDPSGFRPWVFRIATNACLDLLDRRRRRPTTTLAGELGWPDPVPDGWLESAHPDNDPAETVIRRETVDLAFLTAVHVLSPRLRAMLVLRDVLDWSATDVAEALGTTVAAVYSGVRRARSAMGKQSAGSPASSLPVVDSDESEIARRYLDAWERADIAGLADLLAADARMAMPPDPRLFEGRSAIVGYFEAILGQPPAHRIRLSPTLANRRAAFIVLGPDPESRAMKRIGVKVLMIRDHRIAEIRGYMRPDLAKRFELLDRPRRDR